MGGVGGVDTGGGGAGFFFELITGCEAESLAGWGVEYLESMDKVSSIELELSSTMLMSL